MVVARKARHNRPHHGKKKAAKEALPVGTHLRMADIVALCPEAADVLSAYGIHCAGCDYGGRETLEEAIILHGLDMDEARELLHDLNGKITTMPSRPAAISVTLAAAKALEKIIAEEKKEAAFLTVTVDGQGGFCMEFEEEKPASAQEFFHPDAPAIRLHASPLTLRRIGGATVDHREGRFKLDLPESDAGGSEE